MASRRIQAKAMKLLRSTKGHAGQGTSYRWNKMSGRMAAKNYRFATRNPLAPQERGRGVTNSARNLAASHLRAARKGN